MLEDSEKLEWSTEAENLGYLTGAGTDIKQYVYNASVPGATDFYKEFMIYGQNETLLLHRVNLRYVNLDHSYQHVAISNKSTFKIFHILQ